VIRNLGHFERNAMASLLLAITLGIFGVTAISARGQEVGRIQSDSGFVDVKIAKDGSLYTSEMGRVDQ